MLETSYWVAAHRAEVAANSLDLFAITVPRPVEAEILAAQPLASRREDPYATLFRHLRDKMLDPPAAEPAPVDRFAAASPAPIALAGQLSAVLLINEQPAASYARNLGIQVVTVPAVIVALRAADIISDRAARRKLDLVAAITAPSIVTEARRLLDRL